MARALNALDDGIDDLMQCVICQEDYNQEDRLPKFLNCTHTFCLQCIKAWVKNKIIDCPICRDVTALPSAISDLKTNHYILKHIEGHARKTEIVGNFLWCFSCGQAAELECSQSGHRLLTVKSHQVHQKFKQLYDDVNECKNNWSLLINCRRQFQESILDRIQKSFKIVQDQLNKLIDENQWHIAQAESLLSSAEAHQLNQDRNIDEVRLIESYASNARDSRKLLQDAETLVGQFESMRRLRCSVLTTTTTTIAGEKSLDLTFDGNQPDLAVATYALMNALEATFPVPETTTGTSTETTEEKTATIASSIKTKTKTTNGYAAVLRQGHGEQNGQIARPLSNGQVRCFLDFNVDGRPFGRAVILLEVKAAPKMCKAFKNTCLGKEAHYEGSRIFQSRQGEYICGGPMEETGLSEMFAADKSTLRDELGAIRMRHRDNEDKTVLVGTEFQILVGKGPHKQFRVTTVFGRVIEGLDTCEQLSEINPYHNNVRIAGCGVL